MPPWVEQVIDALREPAILLDENGRVSRTNAPARDRFGAWVAGQNYVGVLRQPALLGPVEDAFFGGTAGHARFVHTEAEVETTFDVRVTPIPGLGRGGRPAVLLAFHDTSHASVDAAVRRDFVANVSHELKTPLTAVMGFVETLRGPARDDRAAQERFLGIMAQELSRMDRLVADLLSLSRVETQLRQRPRGTVDLSVLIGEAVDLLSPVAAEAGVSCRWDAPEAAPVAGDRDQLLQVVVNLAENGIKYGARPGEVVIRLLRIPREPVIRGPAWALSVTDGGPGVPAEHVPRLTERFYRVDTGRSREQGGTGLGLSIVKHIVNRHRGRLRIDSAIGQGTTVTVTLPEGPGRPAEA